MKYTYDKFCVKLVFLYTNIKHVLRVSLCIFCSKTFLDPTKYVYLTSDTQDARGSADRSSCKVPVLFHFNRD